MAGIRSIAIAGCLWAALMGAATVGAADTAQALALRWTFAVFRGNGSQGALFAVTGDTTLHTGDRLKFFSAHDSPCYVYWIHLDSRRRIHLLHPVRSGGTDLPPVAGEAFFIPVGADWFRLDDQVGEERFYLLASTVRLDRLETLLSDLSASRQAAAESHTPAILEEIRSLRRQHGRFKKPAERPPTIMGQVRSGDQGTWPDLEQVKHMATRVRTNIFYSKVFTIDHR